MNYEEPRRHYRQTARAEAAEGTARRILAAFAEAIRDRWFDEIRLEDIAKKAGVSVQTVIRRFGGKDGLLARLAEQVGEEVRGRRSVAPGDVEAAVATLSEDYDALGDMVMRMLAQEDRHPAVRAATDLGRSGHRAWLATVFADALAPLPAEARERRLDALVVAADLYVWKLYRRDMNRSAADYRRAAARLVRDALQTP